MTSAALTVMDHSTHQRKPIILSDYMRLLVYQE